MKDRKEIKRGTKKYRLSSTEGSSHKYGVCEECKKHVTEVFLISIHKEYQPNQFTHQGTIFGHKECLLKLVK